MSATRMPAFHHLFAMEFSDSHDHNDCLEMSFFGMFAFISIVGLALPKFGMRFLDSVGCRDGWIKVTKSNIGEWYAA